MKIVVERSKKIIVHSALLGISILLLGVWSSSKGRTSTMISGTVSTSINGKIAFSSRRDGNDEIYVMNANGTGQTRMTKHIRSDYDPVWSPDGKRIAFVSTRSGNPDIWVMDAIPMSPPTQLTNHAAIDDNPEWSPDGTRIAFRSTRTGNSDIWFLKTVAPSPQLQLTTNTKEDVFPTWSSDNTQIAFASNRTGNYDIFKMNSSTGIPQVNLTPDNPTTDTAPAWFGDKIAFQTSRDGNDEIYVMNANGSIPTKKTNNPASDTLPEWSLDGKYIAFASNRTGNSDIWVMDSITGDVPILPLLPQPPRLTTNPKLDTFPTWSIREKIVFQSNRSGNNDIWVMNADGTGQTNLTLDPASDLDPCWSPDRTKIAFSSNRGNGYYAIWVMNADGSMPVQWTSPTNRNDRLPCWSPDGAQIAFTSDRTGNYDIFVMNAAPMATQTNMTLNPAQDMFPTWSPTSTPTNSQIAFVTNRDGNEEIYRMNIGLSGSTPVVNGSPSNLTMNTRADDTPSWSPDGTKIAFVSDRGHSSSQDHEIYVMDTTNLSVSRKTDDTNGWQEYSPTWSPDGLQIAFRSIRNGNRAIYLINATGPMDTNGNNEASLTANTAVDESPNWFRR